MRRRPPDEENATRRLLWAIAGATTFTVIMFFLDLNFGDFPFHALR